LNGLVQPSEASENKLAYFLERFPEYKKTLRLAVVHEESERESRSYQGWQWHDVETHPTKLIRLVTEGISRINLRTRQATSYILRDRDAVKRVLGLSLRSAIGTIRKEQSEISNSHVVPVKK